MHPAVRAVTWLFSWLVPQEMREPLLGDLAQEYALRAEERSEAAALKWYLRQLVASIPSLLWTRLTASVWLSTLGVAVVAYFAVGVAQLVIRFAFSIDSTARNNPLDLLVIFPMVALIAYCAERVRRRAAFVLGAMMLIAITVMTVTTPETGLPLWNRVAWFFVGPAAAILGKVLHQVRR